MKFDSIACSKPSSNQDSTAVTVPQSIMLSIINRSKIAALHEPLAIAGTTAQGQLEAGAASGSPLQTAITGVSHQLGVEIVEL